MFKETGKEVESMISKFLAKITVGCIIFTVCYVLGTSPTFTRNMLSIIGINYSEEMKVDENKENISKFENPKPTQTVDEAKESYINSFISKDELLVVNEYKINWMAFNRISEEKFISLESMIDKLKYYLKYEYDYSDKDIEYYFGSARIEKSEDGEKTFFILNSGENISLSELNNLYTGIKNAINIINKNSEDIFGIKTNDEPILYGNSKIIEEKIEEIIDYYNNENINRAKYEAYNLAKIILEDSNMKLYQKYITLNKELFIENLGVVYIEENYKEYALNSEVFKNNYSHIMNIIIESQYSDGTTVMDSIKDKINELGREYDIKYRVEPIDDNSKVYIVKLLGYVEEENEPYYLGVYEYNSVANHIETIYQLGYGTINEKLKNKYTKS
ncbi:MAG: hypothetical protein SOT71_14185 [Romboutsia timonensis]|uniref:hypothetical protein n=1 Tax=Romboutsia timonensis TaxID=1776391 RepID=UPI002A762719|nr:hypothetical protein [Romboutsia timonensis]MDY2883792.1 hypothetical protein [Romboutsia timonensis]